MKTIEVSDEMYAKLIELATEMTTQDMRCTRMPHMFQIKTLEEVAAYEGCDGDIVWVDDDGGELRSEEDIKTYITDNLYENDSRVFELDDDEAKKKALEIYNEMLELEGIENYLDECEFRKIEVTTISKYQNTFLTSKACQEHIDKNHYHYNEPTVYLNSAWRNPEMELVSTFLCGLVGKKMHT